MTCETRTTNLAAQNLRKHRSLTPPTDNFLYYNDRKSQMFDPQGLSIAADYKIIDSEQDNLALRHDMIEPLPPQTEQDQK